MYARKKKERNMKIRCNLCYFGAEIRGMVFIKCVLSQIETSRSETCLTFYPVRNNASLGFES
jgi:hypothetical protein